MKRLEMQNLKTGYFFSQKSDRGEGTEKIVKALLK